MVNVGIETTKTLNSQATHLSLKIKSSGSELEQKPTFKTELPLPREASEILPDEGYAWVIMAASFINMTLSFGSINAFGVFQTYYLVTMFHDEPAEKIAWISTVCMLCTFSGGVLAGPLIRKVGLRYSSLLGTLFASLGLLLASFSARVWQLVLTQGVIFGLGCALIINISLTTPSLWFTRHRSLVLGVVSSGSGFGSLIMVPVVTKVENSAGIGWAFRVLCIIFFIATGISGYLTVPRTEFKPTNKIIDTKLLRDPVVALLCLSGFFMEIGLNIPILYFPASLVSLGVSQSTATNLIIVFSVTNAFSRVLMSHLSKRLGSENIIIVSHALTAIVMMAIWYTSTNLATSLSFYVLFGIFSVAFLALGPVIISQNYHQSQISQINALTYMFFGLSVIISFPVVGVIFQKLGNRKNYHQIIIIAAASYLISAIVSVFLKTYIKKGIVSHRN